MLNFIKIHLVIISIIDTFDRDLESSIVSCRVETVYQSNIRCIQCTNVYFVSVVVVEPSRLHSKYYSVSFQITSAKKKGFVRSSFARVSNEYFSFLTHVYSVLFFYLPFFFVFSGQLD